MVVSSSSTSSLTQQRNLLSQQLHSSLSSQHLNPNPSYSSYASSIASAPGSRPSSPAAMNVGTTINVPTPPQSPTAFQLKTFASSSSAPPTPPISTVITVGTPVAQTPSSSTSSYFPNIIAPQVQQQSPSLLSLLNQPVTRAVVVLTVILSLVGLGGKFPEHCVSPSYVLYAGEYLSLIASPFVIPLTPSLLAAAQVGLVSSVILATTNILSLALFEDQLTTVFNGDGSRIFRNLFLVMMALTMALRTLMGFVFSRATGWHIPELFFSDSMFECNFGLAPYLFGLLMVQSLFPTSNEKAPSFWNMRRTHVQLILCLVNVIPKTIVWWAGAGMTVGFFASLAISFQRRLGRWGGKVKTSTFEKNVWEEEIYEAMLAEDESFSDSTVTNDPSTPFKEKKSSLSSTWKVMAYVLPTLLFVLLILVGCNQYHTFREDIPNDVISRTIEPQTPYLLTLVLMTAPRKRGATYIKETLSSYLANFPDEEVDSLYSRIQIVVYTHFTDFPGYDDAKAHFDTIPKARKHVKWVRDEGSEKNQRKHLVSAIRKIGTVDESVYLGVMEDDFPFCDNGWQEMLNTIYRAHTEVKDHCGIFVGTGGSGLIFKRSVALTASFILESDVQTAALGLTAPPPDISLQDCLMGEHEFCSSCAGTLVTSRTLLQRHLGYNSSTSGDGYDKNQFQCGWRQPFNGMPNVHTL
ncbi:hypothetical protein BG015_002387 [Linnemannia schmuckeri]|uniref:Uncharacterized protein n=1 Tax=Linnemannia schmuckeri TaxID=64567 RepID=A0A9P5RR99_9FUNG|nr:hypothetical protein BG015_002387 [Linnemannia schmuckeri]